MSDLTLTTVPAGRWAVGVSGGADSVALLLLLYGRAGLSLHVVHLDHETRGGDSAADAAFVAGLAAAMGLPFTVGRRSDVERDLGDPPRNASARYRWARVALFRRVIGEYGLAGVILAHHADDQSETVMLRLLRGSAAVAGMAERSTLAGLTVLRPLLAMPATELRQWLRDRGQPWQEDVSNTADQYLRNRVRPMLATSPSLADALRRLAEAARRRRDWLDGRAPTLPESFPTAELNAVVAPVARHAAGRWLVARGVPADSVSRATCDRLVAMAADAATPSRQTFPGDVTVRRAGGHVTAAASNRRRPPAR